jgi:UDP-glucuronate decarboxylase
MRILITGGTGFIGTNLIQKLLEDNNEIFCLDNLYSSKIDNIKQFQNNINFHYIFHDIRKYYNIDNIDQIFHLACPASPPIYQKDHIYTLDTCYLGTSNILKLALKNNSKVLIASTSEIYGNPIEHPQNELYYGNVNTIGIRSCYDEGKRISETLAINYYKKYKVDCKIARIFNTYGPFMDINDGRVITNFINQILNNKPITIYGDGSQTRSFCYINDTVDGLIKLINSNYNLPINIGNPNEFTIIEIANIIINQYNKLNYNYNLDFIFVKLPDDDPIKRKPDITKANSILNWYPNINIYNGINYILNWYINK